MGTIMSDIDTGTNSQQNKKPSNRDMKILNASSTIHRKQTNFQLIVQKQLKLIQRNYCVGENDRNKNYKIYQCRQNNCIMPQISPLKLGRLPRTKTKNTCGQNMGSVCDNSSRIINFRVLRQEETMSTVTADQNKKQNKMYIKKQLYVNSNHEIITQLQQYTNKFHSFPIFRNILNLKKFAKSIEGNICTTRYKVELLFEYQGQYTLQDQIVARSAENEDFSVFQVIKIFKFLMNTIKQLKGTGFDLPVFSLSHLIISKNKKELKYQNILDWKHFSDDKQKLFHSPNSFGATRQSDQKQSIFSFGMSMLSVCLLTDLSQCYDFHQNTVCISLLEQRLDQLKEKHNQQYWQIFSEAIQSMVAPDPNQRPTLSELTTICNQFINQMRIRDCDSTQMMLSDISTCYNKIQAKPMKILLDHQNSNIQGMPSGRSCQKEVQKLHSKKRKQSDFSGSKCLTARWKIESSEKKKLAINTSLYHKLITQKQSVCQFQQQRPSYQEKDSLSNANNSEYLQKYSNKYDLIDEKWKSQDQIFKNMPSFNDIQKKFQFDLNLQFSKNVVQELSRTETLQTNRKML